MTTHLCSRCGSVHDNQVGSCTHDKLIRLSRLDTAHPTFNSFAAWSSFASLVPPLLDDNAQLRQACAKWQEIFESYPHDAQQALRELRGRLVAMTAARDRACSMLDDAVQLRDDAEQWFPLIAEMRKVGAK